MVIALAYNFVAFLVLVLMVLVFVGDCAGADGVSDVDFVGTDGVVSCPFAVEVSFYEGVGVWCCCCCCLCH